MIRWLQVLLDTPRADFEEAAGFWSEVTGWTPSERRGENAQFLTLVPPAGPSYLKMQAVDGPPGVHLDLDSADRPAQVSRAHALGATTEWVYEGVEVMRSPGGFVFCHTLVEGDGDGLERDGSTILDQVCLDVPESQWEREVAFWRDLTGREPQQATAPGFVRLLEPGQPQILLQRLGEPDGVVRAHPDLASTDRRADTARHVALGATVLGVHAFWTVLTAPGGQVYCLTDRDPSTGVVAPAASARR